jgi:[ribosomal protein S5]-alanine N-acetyltransferase
METFPTLYTQRLILRKLTPDDIPWLLEHGNNEKISRYILNMPHPFYEPDAVFRISYVVQGFKNRERYVFAICWNESGEFIGEISLHVEKRRNIAQLGYWVAEPYWNKGIATEAVNAVIAFAFDKIRLDLVFAECHRENHASEKVLINSGFKKNNNSAGGILQYVIERT